ncbi:PIN domain nuclease [Kineosporia sp. NBRC 101731]|uniref:PIN domain nuclease n=1 Tax=Kineosporia sp. NBRC 101731 TaxID=3032199 RepID=UPI002557B627|nr:PIN domain nuclease [Kineosporia sp. NBRC 101731]
MADTSANARIRHQPVEDRLAPLIDRYLVATCAVLNLEALFSARSPVEYEQIWNWRNSIFEYVDTDESCMQRAQEVQRILAERSSHRVKLPDLIIAATAEAHSLTLLHYDKEFDLIASVTKQSVEWIAPQGSLA